MPYEENKTLALRFHQLGESGDFATLREILAAHFQMYAPGSTEPMTADQGMQMGQLFVNAFPDGRSTIEEQIAENDLVATRGVYRGTHGGDFMGMPATGKRVEVPWISLDRVIGGKVVEHRFLMDMQVMMQQLGAVPARQTAQ